MAGTLGNEWRPARVAGRHLGQTCQFRGGESVSNFFINSAAFSEL